MITRMSIKNRGSVQLSASQHTLILEVIYVIVRNEKPMGRTALYKTHRGNITRLREMIEWGIENELLERVIVDDYESIRGRTVTLIGVTRRGKAFVKRHRKVVDAFVERKSLGTRARKREVEVIEKWATRAYTLTDARPEEPLSHSYDVGKAIALGIYLAATQEDGEYTRLSYVMNHAPETWKRYSKAYVVDIVRHAWLLHGVVICSFTADGEWRIAPGLTMADEIVEKGGIVAFKAYAKTSLPTWSWSK